jgi:hypothetical protein
MNPDPTKPSQGVELPTPTAWPIVAAFGLTLVFFGLVSNLVITLVGMIVGIVGAVGWCRDVFPHPQHTEVPLAPPENQPQPVRTAGRVVQMLEAGNVPHRARIPVEVHPYTAGAFGGLVGAAVMAFFACLWGVFKYGSIWYPINLLAAAGVPELAEASLNTLKHFSLAGFLVGSVAHLTISVLVGLLYVVLVPMLPRRFEWLFGGVIPPLIWSGLLFAVLRLINPKLAGAIDWLPFFFCQIVFGMVCGFVVFKSTRVETLQHLSLAEKLGVEAQHDTEDDV